MFTDTRRIARKPTARQLAKQTDDMITRTATAALAGHTISILDIPKVYAAGRRAHETGADIADAVRAAVAQYRQDR